jgi:hypothetical protein
VVLSGRFWAVLLDGSYAGFFSTFLQGALLADLRGRFMLAVFIMDSFGWGVLEESGGVRMVRKSTEPVVMEG